MVFAIAISEPKCSPAGRSLPYYLPGLPAHSRSCPPSARRGSGLGSTSCRSPKPRCSDLDPNFSLMRSETLSRRPSRSCAASGNRLNWANSPFGQAGHPNAQRTNAQSPRRHSLVQHSSSGLPDLLRHFCCFRKCLGTRDRTEVVEPHFQLHGAPLRPCRRMRRPTCPLSSSSQARKTSGSSMSSANVVSCEMDLASRSGITRRSSIPCARFRK